MQDPTGREFGVDAHFVGDGIEQLVGYPDRKYILNQNRHDRYSFVAVLHIMTEGRLRRRGKATRRFRCSFAQPRRQPVPGRTGWVGHISAHRTWGASCQRASDPSFPECQKTRVGRSPTTFSASHAENSRNLATDPSAHCQAELPARVPEVRKGAAHPEREAPRRGAVVHAAPPLHSRPLGQLLDGRANHIVFTRLCGSVNLFVNRRMAPSLRLLADRIGVPASLRPCVPASLRPCVPASLRQCSSGRSTSTTVALSAGSRIPWASPPSCSDHSVPDRTRRCRAISTACCSRRRASHWEASTSMPANGCCGRTEPASTASSPPVGAPPASRRAAT